MDYIVTATDGNNSRKFFRMFHSLRPCTKATHAKAGEIDLLVIYPLSLFDVI